MEEKDPFTSYNISEKWRMLDQFEGRLLCPKCCRSRKLFCYTCNVPLPHIKEITPKVSLPIKIDILKHEREIDGKSTSVHAAILAPEQVTVYRYPDIVPQYPDDGKTVLIFPGRNSTTVKEYFKMNPIRVRSRSELKDCDNDLGKIFIEDKVFELPFNRALFIDSTWRQSKSMYRATTKATEGMPCIVLQSRLSNFWRHQAGSPRWYLATIEAIHQWLNEIYEQCLELGGTSPMENRTTKYDDLLFFFRHMYHFIHQLYEHNDLLSYRRPVNL